MKLFTIIIFQLVIISAIAQDSYNKLYYESINKAQVSFAKENFKKAAYFFKIAFNSKTPYWTDLKLAIDVEFDYGKRDKIIIKDYMKMVRKLSKVESGTKLFEIMVSIFPQMDSLDYAPEIKAYFEANKPIKKAAVYDFKTEFESLRTQDQHIRDSVIQITQTRNIYQSNLAPVIKQRDSLIWEKLLVLLEDTTLTERSCPDCLNTMELLIQHNSANGKTNWINALNKMLKENRIDLRRYVRIIDEAHNTPATNELRKRNLYFGSFNGIRLYNCMYFTKYKGQEKKIIKQNRKKLGYVSLEDEITIKEWQYKNNDFYTFYPSVYFTNPEGAENKEMQEELLNEQKLHLQSTKENFRIKILMK